ncbi:MAG: hypothetical protein HIU85_17615 [Proteobacteria bacterium]|nr:hypothetical protein [Pseudomonadota bacterium]
MRLTSLFPLAAAAVLLGAQPAVAAPPQSVEAVWAPRHVTFFYQGFTTHYSCDGLRDQIHRMLSKLGARDLKIRTRGCVSMVGVEPFPGVAVTMQVLVPAASEHGGKADHAVAAHWRNVVLMPGNAGFEEQGNCELIEQFKETFLPLFAPRRISYQSNCIPHQLTLGTHLSAEVLTPDTAAANGR